MPAGQVIGRVSVRVLPDTDQFKARAKSQLEKIEKSLSVTVASKFSDAGLKTEMLQAVRKINQENRTMDSRKVRLYSTISTDGMREAVTKAVRDLEARADNRKIRFNADVTAQVTAVQVDEASLLEVEKKLEEWREDQSPLTIDVTLNWVAGTSSYINARIAYLTRPRTVPILPTLDVVATARVATALAALSGVRFAGSFLRDLADMFKNIDKNIISISTLGLAIAGLVGWLLHASANLFALSKGLAQIVPAALLLPGIFIGMGLGLGSMIAVLKDFNDIFPDVGKNFTDLQDRMSENFWAAAEEPMRRMLDTLLPQLNAGLEATATSLGTFFAGLSNALGTKLDGVLPAAFADLAQSIEIAATGTNAFVGILTTLGTQGAGYLPRLAQWFVDISTQFDNFLNAAVADGRFAGWIETAIQNMKDLGGIIAGTSSVLAGFARAAEQAGGTTLGALNEKLAGMAETVNSPAFQSALITAFYGAQVAMDNIADTAGPAVTAAFENIAKTAGTVLPMAGAAIGNLFAAIGNVLNSAQFSFALVTLFNGINQAVGILRPAIEALAPAFGALGSVIGTIAVSFAPILATLLTAIGDAFVAIAPALQMVISELSGAFVTALTALAPVLTVVASLIGDALLIAMQTLAPILPVVGEVLATIASTLAAGLGAILPVIAPLLITLGTAFAQILAAVAPLIPPLMNLVVAILTPLLPIITQIATAVATMLVGAITTLVPYLVQVVEAFAALVDFIMPVLAPAISFLATILTETLGMALDGVVNIFSGAIDVINGVWNIFSGAFSGDWSQVWDGIKGVAEGIWKILEGAFEVFMTVGIGKVAQVGLKGLKSLWDDIWNGIKSVAETLWSSLKSRWSTFLDDLKAAPNAALSAIKKFFSDTWNDIKSAAELAWDAVKSAFTTGVTRAVDEVKALPGKVKSALGDLGSTLVSVGKTLIDGFVRGIKDKFSAVQSTLGDLTSKLTSWKGPESLDRVLLVNAGELVIGGFINGLESRYGDVRKSLKGLTSEVSGFDVGAPDVSSLGSIVNGLVNGSEPEGVQIKVFNYNAAPNNSMSSEEELFAAVTRPRMVGW